MKPIGANKIAIDASEPFAMPQASTFQPGCNKSLDGRIIGLNERFLTVDGKPWLPVMEEFHYSRVPESEREERDSPDESQRREYHCGLCHLVTL
jgi:beta-galactosidase